MYSNNLPNLPNQILDKLRQQSQKQNYIYSILQSLVSIVFPITESILVGFLVGSDGNNRITLIIFLFLIGIIHIVLLTSIFLFEKPLSQFLIEFEELKQTKEKYQEEITGTREIQLTFYKILKSTELSLAAINQIDKQKKDLIQIFENILNPWIQERSDIFWFKDGEAFYNLAIYLFNPTIQELELKFRKCDNRIKRSDRNWGVGVGHVGVCFSRKETSFTNDAIKSPDLTNQETKRIEDKNYYKSVIAEPIWDYNDIIGVFIVTSSKAEQFEKEIHLLPTRLIAKLLAIGYQIGNEKD